eukprot:6216043-Amphidinium_carterae.1
MYPALGWQPQSTTPKLLQDRIHALVLTISQCSAAREGILQSHEERLANPTLVTKFQQLMMSVSPSCGPRKRHSRVHEGGSCSLVYEMPAKANPQIPK